MDEPSGRDVVFSIIFYTVSSGAMLVINKVAITCMPLPGVLICIQLFAAVLYIYLFKTVGMLKVDSFQKDNVLQFMPYIGLFAISVYCNGKTLEHSNVETVIVFRACSPLLVSVLDWMFLGRQLPEARSLVAMLAIVVGAVGYVQTDSAFQLDGVKAYSWVIVYTIAIVIEMTYGKRITQKIDFRTPVWGNVLYTNALSLPAMLLITACSGELEKINPAQQMEDASLGAVLVVLLSCAIGIGISWAGWNCRSKTTATTYTIVGVCCKMMSVLVNVLIWDKHATSQGIAWLLLCLLAGAVYRPAPMRDHHPNYDKCCNTTNSEEANTGCNGDSNNVEPESLGVTDRADEEDKVHARAGLLRVGAECSPRQSV